MDIETFKWGSWRQGNEYKYYLPEKINQPWKWDNSDINILLEEASMKLGELNSYARLVPNIDLFIQLHVTTEAVISSRIEGTQTNIDEALLPEEDVAPERRQDWQEVRNYTEALNTAIKSLESIPISSRLIRQTHGTLLSGVRGEHKLPGDFRASQNWIGGATLKDAVFIPPDHPHINNLMSDLEKFIHNEKIHVPDLIKIGMVHYQFETIHPFLDGNGRIGRLLITLYLVSRGIMDKPLLYLSKFFERHKGVYYDNLMRVRENNDMIHWLRYFLIGVRDTAIEAADTLGAVLQLKNDIEAKIRDQWGRRTRSALNLLEHLFVNPVVQIKDVQKVCGLSAKAAGNLVQSFEDAGFLNEVTGQSRNRMYLFSPYLDKFKT
ncbi:Fic family protein [Rhodohalobacter sp. SW132]|uniref:Fic family protein n=1 Tax=Rhodohalobacter sp. SW132 TaxID=2293433 RepID=UPI000E244CDC|nr:Fic family protein [Rhodohalobacter sp. SW132]REL24832.1 Fic family protein [Rhodohalobacter sp. SW132]